MAEEKDKTKKYCTERVWDVGDRTDCGNPAIILDTDGTQLCRLHVQARLAERLSLLDKLVKIEKLIHDDS